MQSLEILDLTAAVPFQYNTAYKLVNGLKYLRAINLEVREPISELAEWENLIYNHHMVKFGTSIMRIFPYNGQHIIRRRMEKLPDDSD